MVEALFAVCPHCKAVTNNIIDSVELIRDDLYKGRIECRLEDNGCGYKGLAFAILFTYIWGMSMVKVDNTIRQSLKRMIRRR